ncbi:MAG: MotA/TolQ/ExbB proton channel family protein [Candidatus Desantisbacteria bacterium]
MNIFAGLETFLYIISSILFYPVVVGLVFLTLWMVICFGSFMREWIERRQDNSDSLTRYKRAIESELVSFDTNSLDIRLERRLQIAEQGLIKSLDAVRFVIRTGPALGLMGTLIPMGISLSALAQGDMQKMAGSMVTAFTATVVGLACSVMAYLISMVKERWVRADIREMEYFTELTLRVADRDKPRPYKKNTEHRTQTARENEDEISEETRTI